MPRLSPALAASALFAVAALAAPAAARPVMPTNAPVARLLKNAAAFVAARPADPHGHFLLGRLHYFAFATPGEPVATMRPLPPEGAAELPSLGGPFTPPGRAESRPDVSGQIPAVTLTPRERRVHVGSAITHLRRAVELRAAAQKAGKETEAVQPGLYELCLGSAYEDGKTDAAPDWRAKATASYLRAWDASSPADLKQERQPIFGIGRLVSYEAGRSYLRLAGAKGAPAVARVRAGVTKLEKMPPSLAVTPLVFSLESRADLDELIAPRPEGVRFDLDGSGRAGQVYAEWPRPETAVLVWDPDGTGRVTSGRQLFGAATWWLFFADGYGALSALDDDGDGWLRGAELSGLAVWRDRDGDGASGAGEVTPLSATPVLGLAVRATRRAGDGRSPMNPAGLLLRDGRLLPTYDWTVVPRE